MPKLKAKARPIADPWQLLGIKRGLDKKAVKTAFQKAAMRWHPDAPGGNAEKFMDVQRAYKQVLEAEAVVWKAEGKFGNSSSARMGAKIASQGRILRKRPRISRLDPSQKWEVRDDGTVSHTDATYWKQQQRKDAQARAFDAARVAQAAEEGGGAKEEDKGKKDADDGDLFRKFNLHSAEHSGWVAVGIGFVMFYVSLVHIPNYLPEKVAPQRVTPSPIQLAGQQHDQMIKARYENAFLSASKA